MNFEFYSDLLPFDIENDSEYASYICEVILSIGLRVVKIFFSKLLQIILSHCLPDLLLFVDFECGWNSNVDKR